MKNIKFPNSMPQVEKNSKVLIAGASGGIGKELVKGIDFNELQKACIPEFGYIVIKKTKDGIILLKKLSEKNE